MAKQAATAYLPTMDAVINILIVASLIAVVVPLVLGGVTLVRGGASGTDPAAARLRGEQSNRWMRWRVTMQAVAVGVLCFAFWYKAQH